MSHSEDELRQQLRSATEHIHARPDLLFNVRIGGQRQLRRPPAPAVAVALALALALATRSTSRFYSPARPGLRGSGTRSRLRP